ncbi:ABC transporter substrate-binding protein [Brenneria izadpanahii]|uniref:ABC transporter substrate-binding protein n=1 Tax=Brenneria izadpanahii TaxID=2722756 RepID=A0ABX7UTF3_9GAMM|nr:ABC transporter substrate-binding protein [Brenneria izadpanahii]QTF09051.1 ABC transporter substrate-binding protein [Brenneria izadpanahii]
MTSLKLPLRRYARYALMAASLGFSSTVVQAETINAVMHASLRALDPNITTAYIVRDYAYMVYDTLLALDADNKVQPQMAEKWDVSQDGKTYTFVLRDGLKWHDGQPVTAEDCVASIQRWAQLDKLGQVMNGLLDNMQVIDAKSFSMTFKQPTAIALQALSKPSGVAPFILPKRLAGQPPGEPIKEAIGSGPFKFVANEYRPGVQAVFEKFADYVPRSEPANGLAGGKAAHVDRVKWISMPDTMTAVNALLSGEVDFIEDLPMDLLPMLENNDEITLTEYKRQGTQNVARLNFLQPPFDNKLIRQAALAAMDQESVLQAQSGNPKYYHTCAAFFGCDTPYANEAGAEDLVKGDPAKAAALLKEGNYDGTPIVILHATDVQSLAAMPPVFAQSLRQAGFNVQLQAMDWQTVTVRRASKEKPANGGWHIFSTYNTIADISDPVGSITAAANGPQAWFGWPDIPAVEELRQKIALSASDDEKKQYAGEMQKILLDEAAAIPLGERSVVTARRANVKDQVDTTVPVFWNMTKTGN